MRLQFEIDDRLRPVFYTSVNNGLVRCLIDTGASISVCCNRELFQVIFPKNRYLTKIPVRGFGEKPEMAFVREVPRFVLQDENGASLCFNNFHACIIDRPQMVSDLILAYPLFHYTRFLHSASDNMLIIDTNYNMFNVFYRADFEVTDIASC